MIKRRYHLFLLVFLIPLLASSATHLVKIKSLSFEPKKIEVKVGDTVQWQNIAYTDHSATSEQRDSFDTGLIAPQKKSKSIEFSKSGDFKYHCSVHGKTMTGEIKVLPYFK